MLVSCTNCTVIGGIYINENYKIALLLATLKIKFSINYKPFWWWHNN